MAHRMLFFVLALCPLAAGTSSPPAKSTSKEFRTLWADLADADAERAFRAVLRLASLGDEAAALLDQHLQPAPLPDPKRIALLIKDLGNDRFAVRSRAMAELAELAESAEPDLRKHLSRNPPLEVQRRIDQLLKTLQGATDLPKTLRSMRALEVLEKIGSPEARRLLVKIARGFPGSRLTQEAKDSLVRQTGREETLYFARKEADGARFDRYGDPLPVGAVLRLGTVRFRHPQSYGKIIFTPDGQSVAVAGADIRLFDVKTGKVRRRLETNGNSRLLAITSEGKLLSVNALSSPTPYSESIQTWDLQGTAEPRSISWQNQDYAHAWAISLDGKTLSEICSDRVLRVRDAHSGKEVRSLDLKRRFVNQIAMSPDGSLVAGGGDQNGVILWNQKTGVVKNFRIGAWHSAGLAFSADGKVLVANGSPSGEIGFWDTSSGRLLRAVPAEGGPMSSAIFSRDGKLLASLHTKAGIWLWDPVSGALKQKIDTGGLNPHSLAFSPDSRLLAADFGAAVRLWDVRTGKPVANFDEGHVRPVTRMAFSRKPGLLATVGEDNAIRLWDVARGRQIRVWQHTNWVRAVAFSPDGKLLASSCFDDTVRVFKVKTGAEIYKLPGHTQLGGWRVLQFSPDSRTLCSWGDDFYLRAWNMGNGKAMREFRVGPPGVQLTDDDDENPNDRARALAQRRLAEMMLFSQGGAAFSPDGRDFVIVGPKGLDFVNTTTGKHVVLSADGVGNAGTLTFSPDGKWALVKRGPGFQFLRLPAKTWSFSLPLDPKQWGTRPAISPDGRSIAATAGGSDDRIELWEKLTGKKRLILGGLGGSVHSLAFSSDSRHLAAGLSDAAFSSGTFSICPGKQNAKCRGNSCMHFPRFVVLVSILVLLGPPPLALSTQPGSDANPPGIRQVVFSKDGRWLAAAAGEPKDRGELTVWDVNSRRRLFVHRETRGIPTAAFSPDNKLLAMGTFSENARLLDPATGKVLATLTGHGEAARGVCFSPDGKTLAIGCYDGSIRFWDPAQRAQMHTVKGHSNWVYCVSFSPDGKWLASNSADNTVRLWDAKTRESRALYKDYHSLVRTVAFSPDNAWLVAPCWDGSVKVREVPSGNVLADFRGGGADGVAVSPAAKLLAVSGFARGIQLFELSLQPPGPEVHKRIQALIARLDEESYAAREEATKELAEIGMVAEPALRKAMKESSSVEVRIRARRLRKSLRSPPPLATLRGHLDEVETVAFSGDGKLLASGGKDGVVKLWDVHTRKELATLTNGEK